MRPSNSSLLALLLSTSLAACGGSSETTTTLVGPFSPNNGLPFARADLQTVRVTTVAGQTLSANSGGADWVGTNIGDQISSLDFQVVDENTIQMTLSGVTWTFRNQGPPSGSSVDNWVAAAGVDGNPNIRLEAEFGQGDGNVPGTSQSIFFASITEDPRIVGGVSVNSDTFAVSGFETDPTEINALSTSATYTGPAKIIGRTSAGDTTPADILDGTMSVTVDYSGTNAVTGTISGTADASFGGNQVDLDLTPTTLAIGENNFTTTFSRAASSTNTTFTNVTGDLKGTLYGVDAAELGVVISGTATIGGAGGGDLPVAGFAIGLK